jgi:plasmid stabilization system protein ParE
MGRPLPQGLRELIISRCQSGYLALYSYDEGADMALILAVRHQREQDYH